MNLNEFSIEMSIYYTLLYSTIWVISSTSLMMMWIAMEINTMSFTALMFNKSYINNCMNNMIKYFIIQSLSSSIFLMSSILLSMSFFSNFNVNLTTIIKTLILTSLLTKMGAAPFHWWFPMIMIKLSWIKCFFLMTWQKIIPIFLIYQISPNYNMMIMISAITSACLGAVLGLNQSSLKLIFSYSSINHMSWMLILLMININYCSYYFLIYFLSNFLLCFLLNKLNLNYMNQLFKSFNKNMNMKLFIIFTFLSLGGIPPLIGFVPKLLTIILMMFNSMIFEAMILIIFSLISLKFYMNIMLTNLVMVSISSKWNYNWLLLENKILMFLLVNFFLSLLMLPYSMSL